MQLTRLFILFIIGLFIKKAVEDPEMKKLYDNIVRYNFKTIQPFTKHI